MAVSQPPSLVSDKFQTPKVCVLEDGWAHSRAHGAVTAEVWESLQHENLLSESTLKERWRDFLPDEEQSNFIK